MQPASTRGCSAPAATQPSACFTAGMRETRVETTHPADGGWVDAGVALQPS